MTIRPSLLPMLKACPQFQSGETEWTEGGTKRHAYLHALHKASVQTPTSNIQNTLEGLAAEMEDEEIEACEWFYDYIKLKSNSSLPIYFERRMECTLPDFTDISGTPDVVCGADLFDLKWRERDYTPQMAAYALAMFEADATLGHVRVHIGYGAVKKLETFTLTRDEALKIVQDVILNRGSAPAPCDYCGWCAKRISCPALTTPAKVVAQNYCDEPSLALAITNWHPSEMDTPEAVALGLTIWRKILKKWGESMEFHALGAAKVKGWKLPGYELKETKGKSSINDVAQAFALSGLSQSDFLQCCDVRMNTSKKYPDRKGIIDIFAAVKEMKKAPAKRDLLAKLEPVITTGDPSQKLVAEKGGEEPDEE